MRPSHRGRRNNSLHIVKMTMMTTMMMIMRTTVLWTTHLMTELEAILRFIALSTMPTRKGVMGFQKMPTSSPRKKKGKYDTAMSCSNNNDNKLR